jgi:predicted DnaQ family exonuclease/DinG family helicase
MELKGREYIQNFFSSDGQLSHAFEGYEIRDAQLDMALSVMEAFSSGEFCCCEAGTGIGKTISYLLPAVLWSLETRERVIISTHTKNLQEQIYNKDLPLLSSVLPDKFRYVLVKGKGNYLCLRRWREYAAQPSLSLEPGEDELLRELATWADKTTTGDLSSSSPLSPRRDRELWRRICCDTYFCSDSVCSDAVKCFFRKVRRKALSSHIVVVNHSLLIADKLADGGVLGEYNSLIIDESHSLVRVAREGMKAEVDQRRLLWHIRTIRRMLKGKKEKAALSGKVSKGTEREVLQLCRRLEKLVEDFFAKPVFLSERKAGEGPAFTQKNRYRKGDASLKELKQEGSFLLDDLERLVDVLDSLVKEMAEELEEDKLLEAHGHLEMLRECTADLGSLLIVDEDSRVYWIEKGGKKGVKGGSLNATPVDVAPFLEEILLSNLRTGIFTSATLRVMDSFDFFLRSTGLDQMGHRFGDCLALPSTFYYEDQSMVAVPTFLPDPRHDTYRERLADILHKTIPALRRGTLVLFTSISLLDYCYNRLKEDLEKEGILCLGQGIDGTREQITQRFKEERSSVLFGTDSFWQGVDIPGEALEVLIFTRLPFSVPNEPLSQAIEENIRKRGGDPFMEYFLPGAVMKFRQGFGRLIRSTRDMGVVLVMDNRIMRQRYGRAFVESLPVMPVEIGSEDSWIPALQKWWGQFSS